VALFMTAELGLEGPVQADEDLLERGALDSAGIAQLLEFLQDRFGVVVEDDELVVDNFRSIDAIVALIAEKDAAGV
jgi:acyl carrier protein